MCHRATNCGESGKKNAAGFALFFAALLVASTHPDRITAQPHRTLPISVPVEHEIKCEPAMVLGPARIDDAWFHVVRVTLADPAYLHLPELRVQIWVRAANATEPKSLHVVTHQSLRGRTTAMGQLVPLEVGFYSGAGKYEIVVALDDERGNGCSAFTTISTDQSSSAAPATPALAPGELRSVAEFLRLERNSTVLPEKLPNGLRVLYILNIDRWERWRPHWRGTERFAAPLARALLDHPATASLAFAVFSLEDQRYVLDTPFQSVYDIFPLYVDDYGIKPGTVDVTKMSPASEHEFLLNVLGSQSEKIRGADVVVVASPALHWSPGDVEPLAAPLREVGRDRLFIAETAWGLRRKRKLQDGLFRAVETAGGKQLLLVEHRQSRVRKTVNEILRKAYAMPRKPRSVAGRIAPPVN